MKSVLLHTLLWAHVAYAEVGMFKDAEWCENTLSDEQLAVVRAAHAPNVHVHFVRRGALRSELYAEARALMAAMFTDAHTPVALVLIDCGTLNVGVAFRDFEAGMDCLERRMAYTVHNAHNAHNAHQRFVVKTRRSLEQLDEWHAQRACAMATLGGERGRAALFWITIFTLAYVLRQFTRCGGHHGRHQVVERDECRGDAAHGNAKAQRAQPTDLQQQ